MANKDQDYWYRTIHSFVQASVYDREATNVKAIFHGLAAVLAKMDLVYEEHLKRTYICEAENGYLNEHGFERNLVREENEIDYQFSQRIKNLANTTSCQEIKRIVDALLEVGESTMIEDYESELFFNRGNFYNRGEILIDDIYNVFSIIVDNQVHAPYSFLDREYFMDREDFLGRQESSFELFELIVAAVNRSKACGTLYRLIERAE